MTQEQLAACDVPTHEICDDIAETQKEIDQAQREIDALMGNPQENRTEIYLRQGRTSKRQSFIDELNEILEYRKPQSPNS